MLSMSYCATLFVLILSSISAWPASAANRLAAPAVQAIHKSTAQMPRLYSLQLIRNGNLVFEQYLRGNTNTATDIKSASKVVLSALVGIAQAQNEYPALDQPVKQTLGELFPKDANQQLAAITWQDLLTMRSGLESTSRGNYGAWVSHKHWARAALAMPLKGNPGETFAYSTGDSHLVAAGLKQVLQTDLKSYAETKLFRKLGSRIISWQRSPEGIRFGGNSMVLTPQTMRRLALLFLKSGQWQGETLIPAQWIRESFRVHVKRDKPFINLNTTGYGYYWWQVKINSMQWHCALGYGGQHICLQPQSRHAIITTSNPQPGNMDDHYARMRDLFTLSAKTLQ